MAYRDLQAFLNTLEELGELHRITVEVDPVLEIAEITNRVCKLPHGGKALLFERVRGSRFAVATNLFGSARRFCTALNILTLEELVLRMEEVFSASACHAGISPFLFPSFAPVVVQEAVCQENVEKVPDLNRFPFLKNWPGDGVPASEGRFITLPLVVTRNPETGDQNCGMYRVEVLDGTCAAIHWRAGSGGASNHGRHVKRREPMPVAVALGGDPAMIFAAMLPLPEGSDEMKLAGFLRRRPLELVRCRSNPLYVPASAEIVIEGFIDGEVQGGSFGNHTGFSVPGGTVPKMRVTAVTHRNKCVYPATVVGPPPMEDCWLAKGMERLFLPMLRRVHPAIIDINMPFEGIFHGCAVVGVRKTRAGEGKAVLESLRKTDLLQNSRLLIVVDEGTDLQNLSTVAWKVLNNVFWSRDICMAAEGTAGQSVYAGGMLDIDGTRKLAEECGVEGLPVELAGDERIRTLVDEKWSQYGLNQWHASGASFCASPSFRVR